MLLNLPPSASRLADAAGAADRLVRAATSLLVPPVCLACRVPLASADALCGACWRGIDFIRPPVCDRLGIPLPFDTGGPTLSAAALANPPAYDRARAVARFDGAMRRLVHGLKYADRHEGLALFGRWLAGAAGELLPGTDLIVPVPLARWRLWRRRYNQAALLARALGRETGLPVEPMVLVRTRATPSQVGLTPDQRRRNVQGAFAVPERMLAAVQGRNVLLLDDVVTTGATAEACARTLRRAGATRVDVIALGLVTEAREAAL
jgi:ComF family protein